MAEFDRQLSQDQRRCEVLASHGIDRSNVPNGVSLQTDAMIKQARASGAYVSVGRDPKTQLYHGYLLVNDPTPSGSERWLPELSDPIGHATQELAMTSFRTKLPDKYKDID